MKLARLDPSPESGPEIFLSLQGEGKNQGTPSVFVRTSRCNLYCSWCDTPYTWNWRGSSFSHVDAQKYDPGAETLELEVAEVARRVREFACRRLVLTGGEPLLQADECARLLAELMQGEPRYRCEIETNGTLMPPPALDQWVEQYTVSPKLASSGVETSLRLRPAALGFFAASPKSVFKFVMTGPGDESEIQELARAHSLDPDRIYLMPQARDADELRSGRSAVAAACLRHGYRFSDRLHLELYGSARGV